jgi:hypothetical protein
MMLPNARRPSTTPVQDGQPLLEQDDVGRIARHVDRVVDRDAHVGRAQRGGVVDTVAHAADDVATRAQRELDPVLLPSI